MDDAARHAAIEARDTRFDGVFFTGVTSTGVYCRCVCPARTPKRDNRRFFASAAAAERAGFRPCLVCRPEAAPGIAPIDRGDRLAAAALAEIEAGALEEDGLESLAARLGVTSRHLRRITLAAFGASPIDLAQTHRLLTAKRLLRETRMSVAAVAFASGFGSLRRFNAAFQAHYGLAPSRVRAGAPAANAQTSGLVRVRLMARGRWAPAPSFAFLAARALPGVEHVDDLRYVRTLAIKGAVGVIAVEAAPRGVDLTVSDDLAPHVRLLITRVRRAFDLDADIDAIDAALARAGGALAADVAARPGVRLVAGLDAAEITFRAVLGQQVTQRAGVALMAKLVRHGGASIDPAIGRALGVEGLDRLVPEAQAVADCAVADLAALGMPAARAATLRRAAAAIAATADRDVLAALEDVAGVGPWTRAYVRLRALADPDAAPPGDAALARATFPVATPDLSPWRSYATIRAWTAPTLPRSRK
ncbi:MAG: helix-turn-helix domain-containing protein [Alphaproteobacteria bacterium]|nr:helix-turn-helix domain-containing protein [Alphaproteobacteria bacterium]